MKKLINGIGTFLSMAFNYAGEVLKDRQGNPSSKRWAAMILVFVFAFTVKYILVYAKDYDWVIIMLVLVCEVVLILVLFGYSALAEKIVNAVSGNVQDKVDQGES